MNKSGCFWLYKGDTRVAGLCGMFSQFVDDPKIYTITDKQKKIVYGNLARKLKRLKKTISVDGIPGFGRLVQFTDEEKSEFDFDQVRIYTLYEELLEIRTITEVLENE